MSFISLETAPETFRNELVLALAQEGVSVSDEACVYLSGVLHSALRGEHLIRFDEPVAIPLLEAIDVPRRTVRRVQMRRVGDSALMLCGWWWERTYASRGGPTLGYYIDVGRAAYRFLTVDTSDDPVAEELSEKFPRLTDTLARMAVSMGSFTDEDAYRIFRRWMTSNSRRARRILGHHGIDVDAKPQ